MCVWQLEHTTHSCHLHTVNRIQIHYSNPHRGLSVGCLYNCVVITALKLNLFDAFFESLYSSSAPTNINCMNGTHMLVGWSTPSLSESQGYITSYTITYIRSGNRRRQVSSVTVPGTVNSTVHS